LGEDSYANDIDYEEAYAQHFNEEIQPEDVFTFHYVDGENHGLD